MVDKLSLQLVNFNM